MPRAMLKRTVSALRSLGLFWLKYAGGCVFLGWVAQPWTCAPRGMAVFNFSAGLLNLECALMLSGNH